MESEKVNPNKVAPHLVKTLAEDMAGAIGDNKEGFIKKIIHQEEENEKEKKRRSMDSMQNKLFVTVGIILIMATIGLITYSMFRTKAETLLVDKPFVPLIFTDKSIFVEIAGLNNKDKIFKAMHSAVIETELKAGEIEGIYLTENKKVIGLRRFIELLKGNFVVPESRPGEETLVSDEFLIGIANTNMKHNSEDVQESNPDFFILIKMRSLTDVFQNLRSWEAKMFSDLHAFFGYSLSSENEHLLTKKFEDSIVENKNARVLYQNDTENTDSISMMYVFANNDSVVITKSPFTVREIILRLASNQIKK